MAARAAVTHSPATGEEEPGGYEEGAPAAQQARVQVKRSSPRMPQIEEFPPIARKQIAAQQGRIENIANQASRKKPGIFERLASVGLGRGKEETVTARTTAPARAEPSIAARAATPRSATQPAPEPVAEEEIYEDDQLAIPAFLRRQAHG